MSDPHDAGIARASLAEIAALLAPAHPEVADEVLRAHDDPEGYVSAFAGRLDDRGVDEPVDDLPWIALIDALTDRGLLAEFDWKEDAEEIRARLAALESRPSADPWALFAPAEAALPTYDFLHACGRRYREVGAALAVLDIDSDSDCYPVVGLPAARADELALLADRAGFPVEHLGARVPGT
ncbi:hypothetical protein [Streptomyces californicus]|uniref:DUF6630 family protein n=1 Tax=Streptomyces californicus TaxID=67351 RepID=UPI0036BD7BB0